MGNNSNFMTLFEQIYTIVLAKQQVLPHKKDGQMYFFFLYWLWKGANMPKYTLLKKLSLVYFFKSD